MLASMLARAAPAGPLLDAGCGRGALARRLAAAGRETVACDLIARWESNTTTPLGTAYPRWLRADVMRLPFPDGEFAGVAAGEVLEHLDDDEAAVRELARVLAPGGVLALTVPAGAARYGALDVLVGHRRRYARADLQSVLEQAGLRVERLRGWGWPFGRAYDRWIQAPALTRGLGRAPAGGSTPLQRLPLEVVFAMESRWDSGDYGSGLFALACRPSTARGLPPTRQPNGG